MLKKSVTVSELISIRNLTDKKLVNVWNRFQTLPNGTILWHHILIRMSSKLTFMKPGSLAETLAPLNEIHIETETLYKMQQLIKKHNRTYLNLCST